MLTQAAGFGLNSLLSFHACLCPFSCLAGARRVCNRPFKMCQIPPSGMWAAIYAGNRDRQAHNASDAPIYQYYLSADYRCPPASINLVDPLLPAPTTPMPRGCIVGFVHVLLGPLTHEELTQVQPPPHPACLRWAHPPFCYVFGRSLRLPEPVPCQPTGSGAWEMTAETHHQIQQQLKRIAEACAKQEAVAASSAPSSSVAAAPAPAPVESASITRAPSSSSS